MNTKEEEKILGDFVCAALTGLVMAERAEPADQLAEKAYAIGLSAFTKFKDEALVIDEEEQAPEETKPGEDAGSGEQNSGEIPDAKTVKRIKNVLCVAEQGTQTIPYDKVEVMADGPNNVNQITLSIGFTQYGGNLGKVVEAYSGKGGKFSTELRPFITQMQSSSLVNNATFKDLLKKAGKEDKEVMGPVQEEQFEKLYMGPAIKWGQNEGFTEPFSFLIICDSYLHSGSILSSLRNQFAEKTPANGGRERVWITDYLNVRHNWLSNHSNSLVRTSSYRTKYYQELLALGDWPLDAIHTIAMNGVKPLLV